MSEATFEQANLQLKLYDHAARPRLREARNGFPTISIANAGRRDENLPPGSKENANMRPGAHLLGDGCEHVEPRPRQRRPFSSKKRWRRGAAFPASEAGPRCMA